MHVSFELLGGSLRLHRSGGFGDDWFWIVTVRADPVRPDLAVLTGAEAAPPPGAIPVLARKLSQLGFRRFKFQRRKRGHEPRWVEFDLSKLV